jgi:hypothetical protein
MVRSFPFTIMVSVSNGLSFHGACVISSAQAGKDLNVLISYMKLSSCIQPFITSFYSGLICFRA